MFPDNGVEPLRRECLAQQVVPALHAGVISYLAAGGYLAHRRQPRPLVYFLKPGHIVAYAGPPDLNSPVPLVGLAGLGHRGGRVVQEQAYIIVQGLLVTLQGQHVISSLV